MTPSGTAHSPSSGPFDAIRTKSFQLKPTQSPTVPTGDGLQWSPIQTPRGRDGRAWEEAVASANFGMEQFGNMLQRLVREIQHVSQNAMVLEVAWRAKGATPNLDEMPARSSMVNSVTDNARDLGGCGESQLAITKRSVSSPKALTPTCDARGTGSIESQIPRPSFGTLLDVSDKGISCANLLDVREKDPMSHTASNVVSTAVSTPSLAQHGRSVTRLTTRHYNIRPVWCEMEDELGAHKHRYRLLFPDPEGSRSYRASAESGDRGDRDQSKNRSMIEEITSWRFVLHPSGKARMGWNLLCLVFIFYDILTIPLLAFRMPDYILFQTCDWLCTICWTLDFMLAFRTGYFRGSNLVMRPTSIAMHYMRTWMVPDIVVVGFEWYSNFADNAPGGGGALRSTRVLRIMRCIRLIRLGKLQMLWASIEDQVHSSMLHLIFGVVKLTALLLLLVHLVTCLWYAIGDSSDGGWTKYYKPQTNEPDDNFPFWYFASYRWTLAQLNGRTDMDERRNQVELLYTCIVAVAFAVIFMALFISSITAAIMEMKTLHEGRIGLQRMVRTYLQRQSISATLVGNVKHVLAHEHEETDRRDEEAKVLAALPTMLGRDLLWEVRSNVFQGYLWFSVMNPEFPRTIRHLCYRATDLLCLHKGEYVFAAGDPCTRMLFVDSGSMMYLIESEADTPDHRHSGGLDSEQLFEENSGSCDHSRSQASDEPEGWKMHRGDWLSEAALWVEWTNQGKLLAGSATCQACLVVLSASEFASTIRHYREVYVLCALFAKWIAQRVKSTQNLTDLPLTESKKSSFKDKISKTGLGTFS